MYKRIFLFVMVLAAFFAITGCNSEANKSARNKAIVEKTIVALNNQDLDSLDQYIAQDYHRYCQATPDDTVESLDDFKVLVKGWYQRFPDAKMETHLIAAEGDLVAIWATFAGTHKAPMGPYPATGKWMESETFGFFRLEEDMIVESWVTWDNLAVLSQLGLFPTPGAESPESQKE